MYLFSKFFSPRNFRFDDKNHPLQVNACDEDVFHLTLLNLPSTSEQSRPGLSHLVLNSNGSPAPKVHVGLDGHGSFSLKAGQNRTFLASLPGTFFGTSGQAWMFQFRQRPDMQFYGMGEKSTPFEKSDRAHRFWNTDVWADHGASRSRDQVYDPDYLSVPYVIIKRGNTYVGILIDNAHPSIISVSPKLNVANQMMAVEHELPHFFLGAEGGTPSLFFLFGPSLAELTQKLQKLVGLAALPPLWSLGHQQSRWGYQGTKDLLHLADQFDRSEFPNDGLWLDIDYMSGYRVFTFSKEHFQDPKQDIASVQARGYKVVPILDPGVKQEQGYSVYESGRKADVFCRNPAGGEFSGVVWPGFTAFPDFSLERTRDWWATWVAGLADTGIEGAWLDMNDPATGPVDCNDMLFQEGREGHAVFHNRYASLMAEATYQGFLKARPNKRPFLISRSGFTGSQKFTAHWTGDNWSNYHHLHMSIGKTLNLALSGMAINGGDVPGFGGNCEEPLFIDWYKAAFLFPFFRNHCVRTSRPQEPWMFSKSALSIARRYIRLRYKLLPTLYSLFIQHCESGEAILRPLFYDFKDTKAFPLSHVQDQFMIGPWIMQAPFTVEKQSTRDILLPKARWWQADKPQWIQGPTHIQVKNLLATTPLFFREGAILPMQKGIAKNNRKNLRDLELFLCFSKGFTGSVETNYTCDDGESFNYLKGERSKYQISVAMDKEILRLRIWPLQEGYGQVVFEPFTVEKLKALYLETPEGIRKLIPTRFVADTFGIRTPFYSWR